MKVHPATKRKIELEAIDAYEQKHLLGKYKPQMQNQAAVAIQPPTEEELVSGYQAVYTRLSDGINLTQIEARKQHFGMAIFHLEAAVRYTRKATRD